MISSYILTLTATHKLRTFLLPVLDLPAGTVTDEQLGHLLPLLLAGSVQGCVPVPVLAVHDGVVSCQKDPYHISMTRSGSSVNE